MDKSTYCWWQLLVFACLLCCHTSDLMTTYGKIIPQSPVVEIGKNFTATCVLYSTAEGTADDIFWTCKDKVPEEQYTKINDSAVSVTIKITKETCKWLLCKRRSRSISNLNTQITGIMLTKGYPPEKPTNLSCMAEQSGQKISSIVMCSWIPGTRDEELVTIFSLHCRYSEPNKIFNNTAERSNGSIDIETIPNFIELTFWVEVTNSLGTVQSDNLIIKDANYLVKPNPPLEVHIISENTFPRSVLVKWKQPIDKAYLKLKYNIHFKAVGSKDWSEVPRNDTESDIEFYRLQHLMPYTEYEVQVRCIQQTEHGYWSNWSAKAVHWTPKE